MIIFFNRIRDNTIYMYNCNSNGIKPSENNKQYFKIPIQLLVYYYWATGIDYL